MMKDNTKSNNDAVVPLYQDHAVQPTIPDGINICYILRLDPHCDRRSADALLRDLYCDQVYLAKLWQQHGGEDIRAMLMAIGASTADDGRDIIAKEACLLASVCCENGT